MVIIFVIIDELYQIEGKFLKGNLLEAKPEMSDSKIFYLTEESNLRTKKVG